ncbi:replication initiation protein [Cetobacterium sp.]|uniref:replication initiation protein n=1 Tax=Cetobacterium sp. TaxID=2071632 RepID=UPI003F33133A
MVKILNHHNDLNKVRLNNFSKQEYEIFFLLLEQMQKQNKSVEEFNSIVEMDVLDIKKFIEINDCREQSLRTQMFYRAVEMTMNKISKIDFRIKTPRSVSVTNLFLGFKIDWDTGKAYAYLNKECEYLFFKLAGHFMALDLDKYMALKKIHSRNLFRLLSQWRNSDHKSFSISAEELKVFFNTVDYETRDFHRNVLDPALKENTLYFRDLKREVVKNGKFISEYKFSWTSFKLKEKSAIKSNKTTDGTQPPSQKGVNKIDLSYREEATDKETSIQNVRALKEMIKGITKESGEEKKTEDLKKAIAATL